MDHGLDLNVSKSRKDCCHSGESFIKRFEGEKKLKFESFSSWGRWTEILDQGAFKRGWKESDVEDCSRVIVSFETKNSYDS